MIDSSQNDTPKGTIKGVPFVDTPMASRHRSPFVTITRDEYDDLQGAAHAGRLGIAIAGIIAALALILVANIGH